MKRLLLLLLFAVPAYAQVQTYPFVKAQFFDNNGKPAAGGCLFTYISGTTTPLATYTDSTGTFLNTNPVILDSAGRADIWILAQAYSFKLKTFGGINCITGTQLWTEDGINPSANSILAFNNTWTGLNTFNAAVTFNSTANFTTGLTASGPVNMNAGGAMAGTFTGSPIFSGTANFTGGMQATTGLFTSPITSTVISGTAPFVINSLTMVPNLNVNFLNGCTFAVPCIIGNTIPNDVHSQALTADTFKLGVGMTQSGVLGTDQTLVSGVAFNGGTGKLACQDAQGGLTTDTSVCPGSFTKISTGKNNSVCTTGVGSGATCTTVVNISPNQADTSYIASCTGVNETGWPLIQSIVKANGTITVKISTGTADLAQASTYSELDCIAVHP